MMHDVVQTYGSDAVDPIGLYSDKVKLHRTETFVRCSLSLNWSRSRWTLWVVLTGSLCKCGCNGECTLKPLYQAMYWAVNCAQDKRRPSSRHDGTAFFANESERARLANQELQRRYACCEYRGGLPERHAIAGVKSQNVACMCCIAPVASFHSHYLECVHQSPWEPRTTEVHVDQVSDQVYPVRLESDLARDRLCRGSSSHGHTDELSMATAVGVLT